MAYYYKPRKSKKASITPYKKLIKPALISTGIIAFLYFWMVTVIPNISIIWDIFKVEGRSGESADLIPPRKPILIDVPEYTKENKIDLHGSAEVGSTVKMYIDNKESKKAITDNDGDFTFNSVAISNESIEIYVISIDEAGNISDPSKTLSIIYDNKPPKILIRKPEDMEVREENNIYKIIGETEEPAKVTINGKIAQSFFDGSFSMLVSLNEGGNSFKIEATDKAGNTEKRDLYINFSKIE